MAKSTADGNIMNIMAGTREKNENVKLNDGHDEVGGNSTLIP